MQVVLPYRPPRTTVHTPALLDLSTTNRMPVVVMLSPMRLCLLLPPTSASLSIRTLCHHSPLKPTRPTAISCFNPIRVASISLCPRLGDHHASARSHAPSAYVTARFATTTLLAERVYLKAQSIPAIISAMITRSYLGNYNTTSGLHVLDAGHATSIIGSRLVHAATTSTLSANISLILARRLGPSNTNHSPSRNTS